MGLSIHLYKKDVKPALELFKKATLRKSRRRFKREVLERTTLFGYKIQSYKKAKKGYLESEDARWHVVISNGIPRYYLSHREYNIELMQQMVDNDVRDIIELTFDQVEFLEPFMDTSDVK